MAVIDVLTVVDAVKILKDEGPNDYDKTKKFYPLANEGHGSLYMIVTSDDTKTDAVAELDLFAKAGDTIRWRMTTTSMGANYQCLIKGVPVSVGNADIAPPQMKHDIIKVPQVDTATQDVDGKVTQNLDGQILQQTEDVYWETRVLKPGKVTYHLKFVLCGLGGGGGGDGGDGSDGSDCDCCHNHGGYTYDPYINKK